MARKLWNDKEASERAEELYQYAILHITEKRDAKIELERRELYRIFYYDCRPVNGVTVYHPGKKNNEHFSKKDKAFVWNSAFQKSFGEKRKAALRFGERITDNANYNLKPEEAKKLFLGKK